MSRDVPRCIALVFLMTIGSRCNILNKNITWVALQLIIIISLSTYFIGFPGSTSILYISSIGQVIQVLRLMFKKCKSSMPSHACPIVHAYDRKCAVKPGCTAPVQSHDRTSKVTSSGPNPSHYGYPIRSSDRLVIWSVGSRQNSVQLFTCPYTSNQNVCDGTCPNSWSEQSPSA